MLPVLPGRSHVGLLENRYGGFVNEGCRASPRLHVTCGKAASVCGSKQQTQSMPTNNDRTPKHAGLCQKMGNAEIEASCWFPLRTTQSQQQQQQQKTKTKKNTPPPLPCRKISRKFPSQDTHAEEPAVGRHPRGLPGPETWTHSKADRGPEGNPWPCLTHI